MTTRDNSLWSGIKDSESCTSNADPAAADGRHLFEVVTRRLSVTCGFPAETVGRSWKRLAVSAGGPTV